MNIQFSYKAVPERDKSFLQNYVEKKRSRFETLIRDEDYDTARLEIRSEKFATKEAYQVDLNLFLPDKNFRASEDDHTIIEAFDLALDRLIIQIRKQNQKNK